jgi:glycosyltransferase involved in cell wall biosynthesis
MTARGTPRVSVILCVYNGARYLEQAIDSIRQQTFEDFEIVLIDDGSTDGSAQLVDRAAAADSRLRVIHQENRGLTRSLNVGLGIARGEYVARQDADDISRPTRLARQVGYLDKHPTCVVVGTRYHKIDAAGRVIGRSRPPLGNFAIQRQLLRINAIAHSSAFFRRQAVLDLGGYDESLPVAQDYDLWCRLALRGTLANLRPYLVARRQHDDRVGVRLVGAQEQARDLIRFRHCERLLGRAQVGWKGTWLQAAARRELARRPDDARPPRPG